MPIKYYHIDPAIIRQIALGDRAAFKVLFEAYHYQIFSLAWKILKSREAAEDIAQEVLIKIWAERNRLEEIKQLGAFINTVSANSIYNWLRHEAVEHEYISALIKESAKSAFTGDREAGFREMQRHIQAAVSRLSPQQKKVFLMSRSQGLKYEEIARIMGISTSTVKFHLTEALKSIRGYLKSNDLLIACTFLAFFL